MAEGPGPKDPGRTAYKKGENKKKKGKKKIIKKK
jgi:hypothetical protein